MKTSHIIVLGFLAIFVVMLGINFSQSASVYTGFDQARATNKQVHIVGKWIKRDQASYDPQRDLFQFYLQDTLNNVELVHYYDPKPTNFEQAEKVVLIGGYEQERFVADKIVMKCPSKYEATDITAN